MATITARILQSFGLNSGRAAIASRELGVTADTEQPVIGTTVGGAKYLGTEDYVTIATAAPAAIALIRRSFVEYLCDTVGAGADIALDIRAGAQNVGYRLKVYALGATAYKVRVQYDTGVYSDVPAGAATEFVWNGTKWAPNQAASAATATTATTATSAANATIAASATALATPRKLNAVLFDGTADVVVTKTRGGAHALISAGQLYDILDTVATSSNCLMTGAFYDTSLSLIWWPSCFYRSSATEIAIMGLRSNNTMAIFICKHTDTFNVSCSLSW